MADLLANIETGERREHQVQYEEVGGGSSSLLQGRLTHRVRMLLGNLPFLGCVGLS